MVAISELKDKKILVIGGTQMIGRDFVEFCIENGIYPTLANRGLTNKHLFANLNKIIIDRSIENKCINLKNNIKYDLVVDFSCYNITQFINVHSNITYNNYILISTLCTFDQNVLNDSSHWLYDYCKNKKLLEEHIANNNIENISIVRPCVLYGKHDYTNRFYEKNNEIYWKETGKAVEKNKYYMSVRELSKYLLEYILSNKPRKTVHINGEGIHYTK